LLDRCCLDATRLGSELVSVGREWLFATSEGARAGGGWLVLLFWLLVFFSFFFFLSRKN
jgi:hypothetical protein